MIMKMYIPLYDKKYKKIFILQSTGPLYSYCMNCRIMDVLRGAIVWTVEVWEWRRGMGLLYELAYCDDALSVIRHIVYSLGALLFRRHHRHCCPAFSSLQIHLLYILVLATPNHRTLSCIFVFTNSFAAPWHSQPSLMPASLPFEYHLTTKRICDTIAKSAQLTVLRADLL